MKKRIIIIICIFLLLISIYLLYVNNKLKIDYESKNDRYLNVKIKHNNIKYVKAKKIIKLINKKESFIVYFGSSISNKSRKYLPIFIDNTKKLNNLYYVDLYSIQDKYVINGNVPFLVKEGNKYYYKLLKILRKDLDDYIINNNNESVNIKEKRIYSPTIIIFKKGKIFKIISKDIKFNIKNVNK